MLANRVREYTVTTGDGDVTLGGALPAHIPFAEAFSVGDSVTYVIEDGDNYEIGTGTLTAADTLARTSVGETLVDGVYSKEGAAPIDLSGNARVFCAVTADFLLDPVIEVDAIGEASSGAGVVVEDILIKDASISAANSADTVYLSGGSSPTTGGVIKAYGQSHGTQANDIEFLAGTTAWLHYDHSVTTAFIADDLSVGGEALFEDRVTLEGRLYASDAMLMTGSPSGAGASNRYISGGGATNLWYHNAPTGGAHIHAVNETEVFRTNATGAAVTGDMAVSDKLTVNGGAKISVQNQVDGGSANGLFLWDTNTTDYGIYMSQSGAGKSLADGEACTSLDGRTAWHIRSRISSGSTQGFLWENSSEECLMSLTANTGNLYTLGDANIGGNILTQARVNIGPTSFLNWSSAYDSLHIGTAGALMSYGSGANTYFMDNSYYDGTAFKRIIEGGAAAHRLFEGEHYFRVTASSTADSEITWINALIIEDDGTSNFQGKDVSNVALLTASELRINTDEGIHRSNATGELRLSGGPSDTSGMVLKLFGGSHATAAYAFGFRKDAGDYVLFYDGVSSFNFHGNDIVGVNKFSIGDTVNTDGVLNLEGDGSVPLLYLQDSSKDIAVKEGQAFQLGHWNESTNTWTERLSVGSDGTLSVGGLSADGDLGLGTTPSSEWHEDYRAIEIGQASNFIMGSSIAESMWVGVNAYFDGTWKRTNAGPAVMQEIVDTVGHTFKISATDAADSAVSWINAFRVNNNGTSIFFDDLDVAGVLSVGTTSPTTGYAMTVSGASDGTIGGVIIEDTVAAQKYALYSVFDDLLLRDVTNAITLMRYDQATETFGFQDKGVTGVRALSLGSPNSTYTNGISLKSAANTATAIALESSINTNAIVRIASGPSDGGTLKLYNSAGTQRVFLDGETGDIVSAGRLLVGSTPVTDFYANRLGGAFYSEGSDTVTAGLALSNSLRPAAGDTTWVSHFVAGSNVGSNVVTQGASETIGVVSTIYLAEPGITVGSGDTVATAATLFISGAPTEGSNNYSAYVAGGLVYLGGNLAVAGDILGSSNNGSTTLDSNSVAGAGGNIKVFGSSHETNAFDILLNAGGSTKLQWDNSANIFDFKSNAITGVDALTASSVTASADGNAANINIQRSGAGSAGAGIGSLRWLNHNGTPRGRIYGTFDTDINSSKIVLAPTNSSAAEVLALQATSAQVTALIDFQADGGVSVGGMFNLGAANELTIASGEVTVIKSDHIIDTEGDAASDTLVTINGGTDGDVITLSTANSGRIVTIVHGAGNIRCGSNFEMTSVYDTITLKYKSGIWRQIARSSNS